MSALFARFTSLEGGMNSGFDPAVIDETQYEIGINVVNRRGRPRTRPDFKKLDLQFESDAEETVFTEGKFQGAATYTPGAASLAVALISGWIFVVDLQNLTVKRVNSSFRMNYKVARGHFCQVINYFVVQDGYNRPAILSGNTAWQSDEEKDEVPAGGNMAFGHGRLFLQSSKNQFVAGDIYKQSERKSALRFTENQYLSEGGAFSVPHELGSITAMHFASRFDTSTGDGPLLVKCEHGTMSYAVQNARALWNENDISKMQMKGHGIVGQDALEDINQDLMFFTVGGLRSWSAIQQDAVYRRKYINQSAELSKILEAATDWVDPYVSMIQFKNRLLFTVVGEKAKCIVPVEGGADDTVWNDYAFKGIASMDFDQINNKTKTRKGHTIVQTASYDGIWTGLHPTQLLATYIARQERAFVFDKNNEGKNRLWEITDKYTGWDNKQKKIKSELHTRHYVGTRPDYTEQPFALKRLQLLKVWVNDIKEFLPVSLSIKNDSTRKYYEIQKQEIKVKTWNTEYETDEVITGRPQNRPALSFQDFENDYSKIDNQLLISGFELGFKLEWEGSAEISRMVAEMTSEGTEEFNVEDGDEVILHSETVDDYYTYRI